ncbi:hypothetical protein L1987_60251 [Smallanthus sonchifolius]|uniref:Uncharacterized protein n=1 Tax=Smallanthus sonchifolius TaxID=185202 RepID=A0ACB9D7Y2_9ASTR|nr:hypothetical protein L1987_60251 [Smallanthus sonchifolius]
MNTHLLSLFENLLILVNHWVEMLPPEGVYSLQQKPFLMNMERVLQGFSKILVPWLLNLFMKLVAKW